MGILISIIIPNYNGSRTLGKCLESVCGADGDNCEVIIVDDCSTDPSVDIIKQYPCRMISLSKHSGASAARNAGAFTSKGDILFFIDADCQIRKDTLSIIRQNFLRQTADVVIGGTYTPIPYDRGFFSLFQSVFINYFETKNSSNPDYVASHALVIHAETFRRMGGFREKYLPILEDVEFCHRLRKAGCRLLVDPGLQVRHQFNFSFLKSLKNAFRKSRYWVLYSLSNKDLFSDSGTASTEVKITGTVWLFSAVLALLSLFGGGLEFLMPVPLLFAVALAMNRYLIRAFRQAGGMRFAIRAAAYLLVVYPLPIWTGTLTAIVEYLSPKNAIGLFSSSSADE